VEDLARLTECPLTLLHMIQEPVLQPGHLRQSSVEAAIGTPSISPKQAAERLEAIADGLRQRGLTVATRVTRGFNPAWVLRDAMTESQFDLLAMTTHGRGGWRRLWMGSVAVELVRTVPKPTLILRSVLARSDGLSGILTP
jgi:nucleotide-binding universal stress UspA family protein